MEFGNRMTTTRDIFKVLWRIAWIGVIVIFIVYNLLLIFYSPESRFAHINNVA